MRKNLAVIFSITLIAIAGVASITPAFPAIKEHFGLSASEVTLLITVFTLPGVFLAPLVGVLADRLGRKTILIPSLFLFGMAGTACFFAGEWKLLLVFRFFQGLGAASLGTLNVTLIGDIYHGKKRGEIMGYNASVLSTGTAFFPAIGGILAAAGWQVPFLIPLLALPSALLVIFWLKNPEPKIENTLKKYLKNTWKNINQKNVWAIFIINILLFVILYGTLLAYFPELMVRRFEASTIEIGLFMSGFSVITALTSAMKKKIDRHVSAKTQLNLGMVFYIFAMLLLRMGNNYGILTLAIIIFGFGHGLLIPGIQTLLVGFAPLAERAGFMSVNSMVLRIGQTIGPLITAVFYFLGGIKSVFLGGVAVGIVMLLISVGFIRLKKNPVI